MTGFWGSEGKMSTVPFFSVALSNVEPTDTLTHIQAQLDEMAFISMLI